MANSQADNGNESDADDISYKSSSSSSHSSVSFDSSSESSSSSSSHHDGATHHQDDGHVANHNHATVISCSPSFTSHLLSPPPLVSSRIDTPLQQQQQQQQQQQDQQLIQQQYHSYSSFQSPPTSFRPRSRSTSSFSSPLVIHHTRQHDTSHISPLPSSISMESNSTFAATVASVPATGITNNQVPLSSSSSRRNSIVSLVEPSEYVAGPGVDFYPPNTRPLSRPRSNTRRNSTSTPIRNATPVLGPVNRSTLAASEVSSSSLSLLDPSYRRNNSSGRSRSVGGGTTTPTSAGRSRVNSATSPRLVGLGANLAVGTVLPSAGNVYGSSSLSVLRERSRRMGHSTGNHPSQSRSCKQGPGHRKVRRWNNDLFIGIAKDISCSHARNPQRGARIANIYAEAEMDKAKYTMPHVPSHRWTVFRALMEGASHGNGTSSTTSKDGTVRVGSMEQEQEQDIDDWELGRKSFQERQGLLLDPTHVARVRERFLQGEVSTFDCVGGGNGVMSEATELRLRKRQEDLFQNGHLMMQCNVNKRLLNIVTRTCRMPSFSRKVVDAFEFVLVENMSMDMTKNDRRNNIQQDCEEVWEQVLVQKPFVTTRKIASNKNSTNEKSPVIVRMIFSEDGSRAAFHRLLLHAVCQFHGLEVSSSTTSKGHKMLTVTGLCKGSHLRFLEFVPFDDNECDGDHPNHAAGQNHQSSHQACLVSGMSTLQVQ